MTDYDLSSSAYTLRKFTDEKKAEHSQNISADFKALVIPHFSAVITLRPYGVFNSVGNQTCELLKALAEKPMTKTDLFRAIWGPQKFVPRLHENNIHQLLTRVRKVLGINVRSKGGVIEMSEPILVLR